MILLEGRKEEAYNKYKRSIDGERKMISSYMDKASAYDFAPVLYLSAITPRWQYPVDPTRREGFEGEELKPRPGVALCGTSLVEIRRRSG